MGILLRSQGNLVPWPVFLVITCRAFPITITGPRSGWMDGLQIDGWVGYRGMDDGWIMDGWVGRCVDGWVSE